MSGVSSFTNAPPAKAPPMHIEKPDTTKMMNDTNNSNGLNINKNSSETAYQPFRQQTNNQLNQSVVDMKNRRNTNNYQPLQQVQSYVNAQQYATPQQESSYKFPRSNTEAGQAPGVYGHSSNRVHGNNPSD